MGVFTWNIILIITIIVMLIMIIVITTTIMTITTRISGSIVFSHLILFNLY